MPKSTPLRTVGTRIRFITTTDTIRVDESLDVMIRFGAVGIWDTVSQRVAFRDGDVINHKNLGNRLCVWDDSLFLDRFAGLFEIEEGM